MQLIIGKAWFAERSARETGEIGAGSPNSITGHDQIARARTTDPETSHLAALEATGLRRKQAAVLWVFQRYGKMTHETLLCHYGRFESNGSLPKQSASGIRTRAHELTEMGKLIDSGEREKLRSGRQSIVWRVA